MITLRLDSQQLSAFQRCPRMYMLGYLLDLKIKSVNKPMPFIKGELIALGLATYRTARLKKVHYNDAVIEASQAIEARAISYKLPKALTISLIARLLEYLNIYRDDNFKVIAVEQGFSKIIYKDDKHLFVYEGRMDVVGQMENLGLIWMDDKTQSVSSKLHSNSNQFLGYTWFLGCRQGIINYISLADKPQEKFHRDVPFYDKKLVEEWVEGTIRTFFNLAEQLHKMEFIKQRASCDTKYGPCTYARICDETKQPCLTRIIQEYYECVKWEPWQ